MSQERTDVAENPQAPKIYANNFNISVSNADVRLELACNRSYVGDLNLPYPVAKLLAEQLGDILAQFEEKIGFRIPNAVEIGEKLGTNDE